MNTQLPLGQAVGYPVHYAPEALHPISRSDNRDGLGLGQSLPFDGVDIWNAWELTWLDDGGKPVTATAEIRIPAQSTHIVESKSLKLYLGSLAMTRYACDRDVVATIRQDLGACVGAEVDVAVGTASGEHGGAMARLPGSSLDRLPVRCDAYHVDSSLLRADAREIVREDLHTHLLRSLCPVTSQPDSGSLLVSYRGPRLDRESLLRYVVSFREHQDFHENCAERIFVDIMQRCQPDQLTVYARYLRRGGIDINPFRSNFAIDPPNLRQWRQ